MKKYIYKQVTVICTFRTSKQELFWQKAWAESQLVCTDVNVSACRGVATLRFFLMCTASKMKRRQQTMLSFFLKQRSHEEKQMTVILGLERTNITCCSSSESDDKTIQRKVSMAVATFAWCMNFLVKCYSLWQCQKVERSLNNKTLQQCECPEFQTTELRIGANRCRKEWDCWLCCDTSYK